MNAQENSSKYFFEMKKDKIRETIEWASEVNPENDDQRTFLENIKASEGLSNYWIATIEPSIDQDGKISYSKGCAVLNGLSPRQWEEKAKAFDPYLNSRLCTTNELILWYGWRVMKGYWTLEEVIGISGSSMHKETSGYFKSGEQKAGGFSDGVYNTAKIVKHPNKFVTQNPERDAFYAAGGITSLYGDKDAPGKLHRLFNPEMSLHNYSAVLVYA